jgi:1-acyl-sn-glycerol-3-phosphate acyltransferase
VLIFPEGTRTRDGNVAQLKPGFCSLARRAAVPLVPAAIDGAYQAWPRERPFPRLSVIHICFGEPILPDQVAGLTDQQLLAEVQRRIVDCHQRSADGRSRGRFSTLAASDSH